MQKKKKGNWHSERAKKDCQRKTQKQKRTPFLLPLLLLMSVLLCKVHLVKLVAVCVFYLQALSCTTGSKWRHLLQVSGNPWGNLSASSLKPSGEGSWQLSSTRLLMWWGWTAGDWNHSAEWVANNQREDGLLELQRLKGRHLKQSDIDINI